MEPNNLDVSSFDRLSSNTSGDKIKFSSFVRPVDPTTTSSYSPSASDAVENNGSTSQENAATGNYNGGTGDKISLPNISLESESCPGFFYKGYILSVFQDQSCQ